MINNYPIDYSNIMTKIHLFFQLTFLTKSNPTHIKHIRHETMIARKRVCTPVSSADQVYAQVYAMCSQRI